MCTTVGGKDSLVTYFLMQSSLQDCPESIVDWIYVADGMNEYEDNWRLREIVRMTSAHSTIRLGRPLI